MIGQLMKAESCASNAGQGSRVKKGQKLADLESAILDQAEADYLKALADYEMLVAHQSQEVKLAQATYDRTKSFMKKRSRREKISRVRTTIGK